ncbi:MAG: hypothetical protein IJ055_01750 [Oscillospiraceae bacterium]|nr:hypothetical protein [Oscillospiraceae bacterium]
MPFIHIHTNTTVSADKADAIKAKLGKAITDIPGKSEQWLMVGIDDAATLYFQGNDAPAAIAQVSLYGSASGNALDRLTSDITEILHGELALEPGRIYVSYMTTPDWGWSGRNF